MQEFVWAESISFFYGRAKMSLSSLTFLLKSRTLRKESVEIALEHALTEVRQRESTDPRDRVFALLNIIPLT